MRINLILILLASQYVVQLINRSIKKLIIEKIESNTVFNAVLSNIKPTN